MPFGWKIVTTRNSNSNALRSYNSNQIWRRDSLVYCFNKWTLPMIGCGPLALFKTYNAAIKFIGENLWYDKIYRCEYTPSTIDKLWYTESDGSIEELYYNVPNGTVFAKAIKLLF